MTLSTTRRRFIQATPLGGLALLMACSKAPEPAAATPTAVPPPVEPAALPATPSSAAAPVSASLPMVDEKSTQAQALGYVADAGRADKARFPVHVPGSQCAGCAVYQGTPGEAAGACTIFQGQRVSATGWCSAFVKRV